MTIVAAVAVTLGACVPLPSAQPQEKAMMEEKGGEAMMDKEAGTAKALPDQAITPHFVRSTPAHREQLQAAPQRVQINFDFTLHESSAIAVTKDGQPLQVGKVPVEPRGQVLQATLPEAGQGLYVVGYKACWPDRSCHDGQFAFTVQP